MPVLILNSLELAAIAELRDRADAAPVHMPDLLLAMRDPEQREAHRQRMTRQSLVIPLGYLAVYGLETGHPGGTARHLSVSVDRPGKLPSLPAAWAIAEAFGFVGAVEDCMVYLEDLSDGQKAANLVQLLRTPEA